MVDFRSPDPRPQIPRVSEEERLARYAETPYARDEDALIEAMQEVLERDRLRAEAMRAHLEWVRLRAEGMLPS